MEQLQVISPIWDVLRVLNPPQNSDGLVPKTGNDLNHFFVLIIYMHWNIMDLLGLIQFVIKINFIFKFLNRVATRKNKTLHNMSMACTLYFYWERESLLLKVWSFGPVILALPRSLVEMQDLRPHLRVTEKNQNFNKISAGFTCIWEMLLSLRGVSKRPKFFHSQ